MEIPDHTLLDRWATGRDERAFRALVERHLPLVHGVARRVAGNDELARDSAQASFIRLAQRAALIPPGMPLEAWLHRTARNLAIDAVRSEGQRKKRESAAADMVQDALMHETPEPGWAALAPMIDDLVNRLPESDRRLLLLRFYANESHATIARRLGLTEGTARKRSLRAIGKLRALLGKRGIATTTMALAQMLPLHAAVPQAYAGALVSMVVAQGITPLTPTATHLYQLMTTSQKSAVALAALIFMGSVGYAVHGSYFDSSPLKATPPGSGLETAGPGGSGNRREARTLAVPPADRLREILAIPGRTQRMREMFAFLEILPRDRFAESAALLRAMKSHAADEMLRLLADSWAQRDPVPAAEWARVSDRQSSNAWVLNRVLAAWGGLDAPRAMNWVMTQPREGMGSDNDFNAAVGSVLAGLAQRDFDAAVKLMETLPDALTNDRWAVGFSMQARDQLKYVVQRLLETMQRGGAWDSLLVWDADFTMSRDDAPRRLRLLISDKREHGHPGIDRLFSDWQKNDPNAARDAIATMEPGADRNQAVAGWCEAAAPAEKLAMLDQYPEAVTDDLLEWLLGFVEKSKSLPDGLTLARRIQDPERQASTLQDVLTWWAERDASAAQGWIDAAKDLPPTVRERLTGAVTKITAEKR